VDPDPSDLGEEQLAVEQVGQQAQALLHRLPATLRHVQISSQWRLPVAGEENALGVHPVIQDGDPRSQHVTGHVHHLRHQV